MEVDIDIRLEKVTEAVVLAIKDRLNVEFTIEGVANSADIVVRSSFGNREGVIDHIVSDFLSELSSITEIITVHHGILRLGIFYDIEETVVFPFRLSSRTVKTVADLNLSIDAAGYPCSSDE